MTTAIVIALISAAVSLIATAASAINARSVAKLGAQLEEQQHARTKEEQAAEVRARYRDPLLTAAFDLQSRLFNIVGKRFLVRYANQPDEAARTYAVMSTLYVLAEYLGWVEIIRREIQFLDLGDEAINQRWLGVLEQVRDILASDDIEPVLRVFRAEQRAIGEIMLVTPQDGDATRHLQCLGYASFVKCMEDQHFGRWFEKLRGDLSLLGSELESHLERITRLQHALVDVLDVLDPECRRFALARRTRLSVSGG